LPQVVVVLGAFAQGPYLLHLVVIQSPLEEVAVQLTTAQIQFFQQLLQVVAVKAAQRL
jgi:hypothetical protein